MAAPVLQSGETYAAYSSATSWPVDKPASVAAGDLLLVVIETTVSTGWTPPAGWTAGPTQTAGLPNIVTYSRIADGTEGATFTFTGNTSRTGGIVCHRITGTASSPIDASSVVQSASGNPLSIPTLTTLHADSLLLAIYVVQNGTARTWTTPTGMSSAYTRQTPSAQFTAFKENRASTGATGVRDSNCSSAVINRAAIMLAIAPVAATVVTLGQATETDTAQPITRTKARALGQATETDVAQPVARVKRRTLGQATETDAAQPVARVKLRALGQAVEVGLAQAFGAVKARLLGQAEEVDEATALALSKALALGQAEETDTAGTVTGAKSLSLGQATELDEAGAVTGSKVLVLGQAEEFDLAQAITVIAAVAALSTEGYTNAVVGILTVSPVTGIFTSPANRN